LVLRSQCTNAIDGSFCRVAYRFDAADKDEDFDTAVKNVKGKEEK